MEPAEPSPVAPVLDEHELATVVGLLARVIRIDYANKRARKVVEECQAAMEERKPIRTKFVDAIGAFGFDMKGADVWDRLKSAIGEETYNKARKIATDTPIKFSFEGTQDAEKKVTPAQFPQIRDGASSSSGEQEQVPKISDAILEFLRLKGKNGALVQDVKDYLAETYGMRPHEKTPGMTLYRLSRSDFVYRKGRRWFIIEKQSGDLPSAGGAISGSKSG